MNRRVILVVIWTCVVIMIAELAAFYGIVFGY